MLSSFRIHTLSFFFGLGLLLTACNTVKTPIEQEPPQAPTPPVPEMTHIVEEDEPKQVIEPIDEVPVLDEGPRTIVGAFRSVKGVMDPLSCYCGNGGYVDSPAGETVAVCFEDHVEISSRDYIEVTGTMVAKSIESNGSCPGGMKIYLSVSSYKLEP